MSQLASELDASSIMGEGGGGGGVLTYSKLGPQSAADFLNAQAIKLTPEGRCAGGARFG